MRRRELHLPSSTSRRQGLTRTLRVLLWWFIWSSVGFALMYGPLNQGLSNASVLVGLGVGLLMAALLYRALGSRRSKRKWKTHFICPARLLLLYLVLIVVVQLYSTGAVPVPWRNYGYQFDRFVDAVAVHAPGLEELPSDWHELRQLYHSRATQASDDEAFLRVVEEWLTHIEGLLPPGVVVRFGPSKGEGAVGVGLWASALGGSVYAASASSSRGPAVWAERLPSGIGYMRITSFTEAANSVAWFDRALAELATAPALILDVRQGGGTSRKSAEKMAGRFLADQVTYGTAAFRHRLPHFGWVKEITYTAVPRGEVYPGAVILLTGPETSAAAEAFVLALQASGRALVMGEPTAGMLHLPIGFHLPGGKVYLPVGQFHPVPGSLGKDAGLHPDIGIADFGVGLDVGEDVVLKAAIHYLIQQL